MKVGVWLDKKKAVIVTLHDGEESINTIFSNIEHYHVYGGSGTRLKGGPQDVVQDSKYLEREKHEIKRYFDDIILEINKASAIVLFGPAEMRKKLNKEIIQNHAYIITKIKDVVKTDSMNKKQIKAWVKNFFNARSL